MHTHVLTYVYVAVALAVLLPTTAAQCDYSLNSTGSTVDRINADLASACTGTGDYVVCLTDPLYTGCASTGVNLVTSCGQPVVLRGSGDGSTAVSCTANNYLVSHSAGVVGRVEDMSINSASEVNCTGSPGCGFVYKRAALTTFHAMNANVTITLSTMKAGIESTLTGGMLVYEDSVVDGNGGGGSSGVTVTDAAAVSARNLTIVHLVGNNGSVVDAIRTPLTVRDVSGDVSGGGTAENYGGLFRAEDTSVDVADVSLYGPDNTFGAVSGGVFYFENCVSTLRNVTVEGVAAQFAGGYGGVVAAHKGSLTVRSSSFTDNAATSGGALGCFTTSLCAVYDTNFYQNQAQFGFGGAVATYQTLSPVVVMRCEFDDNSATSGAGGGLGTFESGLSGHALTFTNNYAADSGGGLLCGQQGTQPCDCTDCVFTDNLSAGGSGGGMASDNNANSDLPQPAQPACTYASVDVGGSTFERNAAAVSGGGFAFGCGLYNINNTNIVNNTAPGGPGGVVAYTPSLAASDVTLTYNYGGQSVLSVQLLADQHAYLGDVYAAFNAPSSWGSLHVYNGSSVTLERVVVVDNTATTDYAGVVVDGVGDLQLQHSTFTRNTATGTSGALYVTDSTGNVHNCSFTHNSATAAAATLALNAATLSLTLTTYTDNSVSGEGGGLFCGAGSVVSLTDSTATGNSAVNGGFAIATGDCDIMLTRVGVSGNTASGNGGGLAVSLGSAATIGDGCDFQTNTAGGNGGGVRVDSGSVAMVTGATVLGNNSATGVGGGLSSDSSNTTVGGSVLVGDNDAATGGGLSFSGDASAHCTVSTATLMSNTATSNGGGCHCGGGVACALTYTVFVDNSASLLGGGLASEDSDTTATNSTFTANSAQEGGGVGCSDGVCVVSDSVLTSHTATSSGGAVFAGAGATLSVTRCAVTHNSAASAGGGVNCDDAPTTCVVSESEMSHNSANQGAGLSASLATFTASECVLANNTAAAVGGGLQCLSATCTIADTSVTENTASAGGGLYAMLSGAEMYVTRTVLMRNSDGVAGYLADLVDVSSTTIAYNDGTAVSCQQTVVSVSGTVIRANAANAAIDITDSPVGTTATITNTFVSENSGIGVLCGDATINATDSVVCESGITDVVCNLGCAITGSALPGGCNYNDSVCDGTCIAADFCVPTKGVFSGPYAGCHACDGVCWNGTDNCNALAYCADAPQHSFTCACITGYQGDGVVNCTDIDECTDATHDCDADATCTNTIGSFTCACNSGYEGNGRECVDVDECAATNSSTYCSSNAICSNSPGSFGCVCNGDFWGNGTACSPCPLNTESPVGSVNLTQCVCKDKYFADEDGVPCYDCPPGSWLPTDLVCVQCDPGSFSNHTNARGCEPCPSNTLSPIAATSLLNCTCIDEFFTPAGVPGTECERFCPKGSKRVSKDGVCLTCGSSSYTDAANMPDCTPCPRNNYSPPNSTSILDCECVMNTFNKKGVTGVECEDCPVGAVCRGGTSAPYAAKGYAPGEDGQFVECVPREACLGNGKCGKGYTGDLCSKCAEGYYAISDRCYVCSNSPSAVVFLCIFALWILCGLLVWFNTQERVVNRFASLVIGVNSLQIAAVYGKLDIEWPRLAESFFNALSIANLNIELVAPECAVDAANPFALRWLTTMFLPLLLVLLFLAVYGVAAAWAIGWEKLEPATRWPGLMKSWAGRQFIPTEGVEYLSPLRHTCQRAFYQIMTFAYLPLSASAFEFFDCVENGKGERVIATSRETPCNDKVYYTMFPFAILFCLLYPIGMPIFYFLLLEYKKKGLGEVKFNLRYGFLVGRFRPEYYRYELAVMARKLGVVLCMSFLTNSPYIKAGGGVLVLIGSMIAQAHHFPYRSLLYNVVELVCLMCAMLVLLLGIMFQDASIGDPAKNGTIITTILVNLLAIVVALAYDFWRLSREERESRDVEVHRAQDTVADSHYIDPTMTGAVSMTDIGETEKEDTTANVVFEDEVTPSVAESVTNGSVNGGGGVHKEGYESQVPDDLATAGM